jgi:hypothetical protein
MSTDTLTSKQGDNMTFEGLVETIKKTGMDTKNLSEDQIMSVARALNLELPLQVSIVEYTDKRGRTADYVKTSNFPIGAGKDGKAVTARGLFLRVEAVDLALEALQSAKALLADGAPREQVSGGDLDGEG